MMYTKPITPDELYHHGIKGQKWGIRRFQNADGGLTAAGERRYKKQEAKRLTKELNKYDSQMTNAMVVASNAYKDIQNYNAQTARLMNKASNIKARNPKRYDKKIAKYEAKADEIVKKYNIALSKIDATEKDYQQGKQMVNKLLKELDDNKDFVYSVRGANRYADRAYTRSINNKYGDNKSGWYYQSAIGNDYRVKAATDRRRKKEKYQTHRFRSHTPVRTEYYMY